MSQIRVNNLTFYYEGSFDNIFDNTSFSIDTNWKLGFIGRNGKGKTTFLNLLLGKYEYIGSIQSSVEFEYFPYGIPREYLERPAAEFAEELKPGWEEWRIFCELNQLGLEGDVMYRPFGTLSFGERTKILLALLFSGENHFLLIDEPTNHLDQEARETVKEYLARKKGFILVSHDRDFLDGCIDHVLVLNRQTIEVQAGNFSSWQENKQRKDAFAQKENEKHRKEISKLKAASKQARQWADKNEGMKIGFNPSKEHDRFIGTRPYIGAKTKKMQSRVKQMENRIQQEIHEKEGLLKDIETPVSLKLNPLRHEKNTCIIASHYGLGYPDGEKLLFEDLSFSVSQGERIFIQGANGCGKSSLLKAILQTQRLQRQQAPACKDTAQKRLPWLQSSTSPFAGEADKPGSQEEGIHFLEQGELKLASGLIISYINQDTSFLQGSVKDFCWKQGLEESVFCAILRQLDMERVQFEKNMENYSEGQKKKVLIAASLLTPAHLYLWDEPLNYIDLFSRMQIEELLLAYKPTMLIVDHDVRFQQQIATRVIQLSKDSRKIAGRRSAANI